MKDVIKELYDTVKDRKSNGEDGSYTKYLFDQGLDKILKKVGEESTEVIISSKNNDKNEQINEICDLTYHLMVLIAELNISLEDIENELIQRTNKINNFKGERKKVKNF